MSHRQLHQGHVVSLNEKKKINWIPSKKNRHISDQYKYINYNDIGKCFNTTIEARYTKKRHFLELFNINIYLQRV